MKLNLMNYLNNQIQLKLIINLFGKQLNDKKVSENYQRKEIKSFINLEAIKKAFEYTEINCVSGTNPEEQLKKFIQNICNTMENQQQTENQLEIQGFMKEWNNQRKWLLNQV